MTNNAASIELPNSPLRLTRQWRIVISVLLSLHLLALIAAPLAMTPTSPLLLAVWSGFRPYLDGLYLNHGFHFFAPDPGPSHLIRYELDLTDGSKINGVFPDPQQHTPRLLYHRHFMLSEFANRLAADDARKADLDRLAQSFAEHLLATHRAVKAKLYLQRHFIPTPEHVLAGLSLNDPQFLHERALGEWSAAPITSSPQPTSSPIQPLDAVPIDTVVEPLTEPISPDPLAFGNDVQAVTRKRWE